MKKLKWGLIGGGEGSQIGPAHRLGALADGLFEFSAAALDHRPDKGKNFAKILGVNENRAYGDWHEMLTSETKRDDRIDLVTVATPNSMHFEITKAFLEAGFNVLCEKPMTMTVEEGEEIVKVSKKVGKLCTVNYCYSAYPMVRQARAMVQNGELGNIRSVRGSYLQGWLGSKEEDTGNNKQAEWRTDPKRSGAAGGVGDIGSHTLHLIEFITGIKLHSVAADLSTFVKGRKLDDDASILLRLGNGVKGSLSVSQIAVGEENNLSIAIYGEKASLKWKQENPNQAEFNKVGSHKQILTRASFTPSKGSFANVRIPPGHPEGYIEAFAQLYSDFADLIRNKNGSKNIRKILPNEDDGLHIMKFINSCVYSSNNNSKWINLNTI